MNEPKTHNVFNQQSAESYDKHREKLNPIKDAIHLSMQLILSNLRDDAQVLCVGVGTGAELIYLAQKFPKWHFTAVEPAPAMMKFCRQRIEELGIAARCSFHEGYMDTLPDCEPFDAATSILVSHFIAPEKRIQFFAEIYKRLRIDAFMINADLATNMSSSEYDQTLKVWVDMHNYAGMPINLDAFSNNISLLDTDKINAIIKNAGFDTTVLFFQTLLIHAWFSRKHT